MVKPKKDLRIGEKYWFNYEHNNHSMKSTYSGKLADIQSTDDNKILCCFTDVKDDEGDFFSDKEVYENDVFDTAEKALAQAEEDWKSSTDNIKAEINTLKDLLLFPLDYRFNIDRRAKEIYMEKVKEITGFNVK